MPMMDIRVVRMRVPHRPVDMPVRVRLEPVPIRVMTMAMMLVVHVRMRVLEQLVLVRVFVHFRQV